MPLPTNSRLGPYEIKSPLGFGGMGEVYRARDSRLNRDVAIKILRSEGTGSSDLRSRFEREARAVAALNHPNIVAVYDFGIEESQQYIVSELIEGEPLRAVMRGKAVASRKLVDIASQVADGLAAAHAAGIVHRDLKPENIMIAKDGRVKILDFGLARQAMTSGTLAVGSGDETIASIPEANRNLTEEGAVIGTPSYMSPEQALGRELNYHSDQFSFGLILYELASGKQAFAKASGIETMAAIVREEPAPMEEKLPPPLRWIIDRCLAKEPEQRYESTRDLYRDLKNLRDHFSEAYTSGAFPQAAAVAAKPSYKKFAAICLGCMVLAALLGYVLKPSGQNIGDLQYTPFAADASIGYWSPDGKSVAYAKNVHGTEQTFLKILSSPVHQQMTHAQVDTRPLGWSGDGSHIILVDFGGENHGNRFYSLSTSGGEPEFIIEDDDCATYALSRDGKALAVYGKRKDNLFGVAISDPIGSPFVDYEPAPFATNRFYDQPLLYFAPDGRSLLLIASGADNRRTGWLLPYPGGGKAPQQVLPELASLKDTPRLGWMPDNRHLVVSMSTHPNSPHHLWLADIRSGNLEPRTNGFVDELWPRPSPDGKSLLITSLTSSLDVVSLSVADGSMKPLVSTGHGENMASWAGKQEKMVWVTDRSGAAEIWLREADGTDRPIISAEEFPGERLMNPSLSPLGDRIVFAKSDLSGTIRLWITSTLGGTPIRLTNAESGSEFGGSWSPDGGRFVYFEVNGGDELLNVVKTGGGATPLIVKTGCQALPDWSSSGDWITCLSDAGWNLVSPDGKASKALGRMETSYLSFSKDGKRLYGILDLEPKTNRDGAVFFFVDVGTLQQNVVKDLGVAFQPRSDTSPGIRFSMSPDGKSFLYSTAKSREEIWMLKGFKQPSWFDSFARR